MATYTITRALSRVNALQDKLNKAREQDYIVTINTIKLQTTEAQDLLKTLKGNMQSVLDIKNEILKIKLKIQESNLTTKVEVAGKEMSVREAIETKYLLENYFTYISNTMQTQMLNAKRKLVQAQQDIEMQQAIAVQDITKSLGKELSSSEIEERAKLTIQLTKETKELSILSFDGVNNAEDSFKTFESSVRNFLEEVDYVLSESNATTTIEV